MRGLGWVQLSAPDSLEQQFKALEGDDVDDDLAKMKRGMLSSSTTSKASLPEGRPYDEVPPAAPPSPPPPSLFCQLARPDCCRPVCLRPSDAAAQRPTA